MKEVQEVIVTMLKFLTFKLLLLTTFFLIYPVADTVFAQDDDFFDSESGDWSDDALDESPVVEPATPAQEKKPSTSVVKKDDLPDFESMETAQNPKSAKESKSANKKEAKKEVKKETPQAKPVMQPVKAPEPVAEKKPMITITAPVSSQPKFVFNPILQPEQNVKSGTIVKRAGPPLVLIARPVYAPYSVESKTMYISAAAEAYFHFKLGALPGISVIPIERISNSIQYFRDFSRRISSSAYKDAAKKMGAAYLFYSEYEPQGKKVKFATEIYSIADNKKIAGSVAEIELSKFEDGLFDFAIEAAGAMIGAIPQSSQEFFAAPVLGNKAGQLGDAIVSLGEYSKSKAESALNQFEKLAKDNSQFLGKYVAAQVFALAEQYEKSIMYTQQLIDEFGSQYPALQLELARLYRMQGSFDEALSAANKASSDPSLKLPSQIEKAQIQEARGNLQQAKSALEAVLAEGGEDGEILFHLALVSIGLNDLRGAKSYLDKASAAGRTFDAADYYNLGMRYESTGSANEEAINSYRYCLGLKQDDENAWQKLAALYTLSGREAEAAVCYVNLFQINNNIYKDYLYKAGTMFENGGYFENAKDVYELYLGRRFDNPEVKIRLAKIELYSGQDNCKKAIKLVEDIDTNGQYGEEVKRINSQCNKEVRVVVASETSDKSWKAVFFWRLSSGAVMLGGIGAGYAMDLQVKKKLDAYNAYDVKNKTRSAEEKVADVKALHDDLKKAQDTRNLCYLGAGAGGASLVLSIVLPIVWR